MRSTVLLALSAALAAACGSTSSPSKDGGPEPEMDAPSDTTGTSEAGSSDGGEAVDAGADAISETMGASEAGSGDGGGTGEAGPAASCAASGGTASTSSCCGSTGEFPNTCSLGACSCSPSNSHAVQICTCPAGKCFDGTSCR
jgi:hypothetical protein